MFDRKEVLVKTDESVTLLAGSDCADITTVTITPLLTCAGLAVAYNENGKTKIYAAHLSSGTLDDEHKKALEKIKSCADTDTSIHSVFSAGADELDSGYEKSINEVNTILGVNTVSRAGTSFLRIDLKELTAIYTSGKTNLGPAANVIKKNDVKKPSP